jgi:hypothetical protein
MISRHALAEDIGVRLEANHLVVFPVGAVPAEP